MKMGITPTQTCCNGFAEETVNARHWDVEIDYSQYRTITFLQYDKCKVAGDTGSSLYLL